MVSGSNCGGSVHRKDPISVSQTLREGPAAPAMHSPLAEADLHAVPLCESCGPRANTSALPIILALSTAHQSDSYDSLEVFCSGNQSYMVISMWTLQSENTIHTQLYHLQCDLDKTLNVRNPSFSSVNEENRNYFWWPL